MKAYKLEVLIVDHDELGADPIKHVIENAHYPNHCISPSVMSVEEKDIGEWDDDHPLNWTDTIGKEFRRIFSNGQ